MQEAFGFFYFGKHDKQRHHFIISYILGYKTAKSTV